MTDSPASDGRSESGLAKLIVLTGPSGVGKGSLMGQLRDRSLPMWLSVSATTRAPRPGETNGEHYFFATDDEFDALVAADELLEHARFAGNRYGTPRAAVMQRLAARIPVLLEIELDGARQVRRSMPEALFVFLAPPSREELRRRLVGRATETDSEVAARLAQADVELAAADEFDVVIINDDLSRAADELIELIVAQ